MALVGSEERRRRFRGCSCGALSVAAVLVSAPAQADVQGFALDRYEPATRGSDWFQAESLDLRGRSRFALGAVLDWAYKPLVGYDLQDNERVVIIKHQVFTHLGAALTLFDRVRVAMNLPVLVAQRGERAAIAANVYGANNAFGIGDLRLGADVRLAGTYGEPLTLALGAQVFLPTGSQRAYSSDGLARVAPRATLSGILDYFEYSVRVGALFRNDHTRATESLAADLDLGVALGARLLDGTLLVGPEVYTAIPVTQIDGKLFDENTPPLEGILGVHLQLGSFRAGIGAGTGFTSAPGTPVFRGLASLEWFPEYAPPVLDRDADGVLDDQDQCVDVPGGVEPGVPLGCPRPPVVTPVDSDADGVPDEQDACKDVAGVAAPGTSRHGCPADSDADGIIDVTDACKDVPGVASEVATKNGCPPDSDADGILDASDACPNEPGEAQQDPKQNGCPSDRDKDGVLNEVDACPDVAGVASDTAAQNGCPRVQVTGERIVVLDRIEFETNRAVVRPESEGVLRNVLNALETHPEITALRVEGHTDNRGAPRRNQQLSLARAEAVVAWLVSHGIPKERLSASGLGQTRPIDSNATEAGRQNNRRVEFHVVAP